MFLSCEVATGTDSLNMSAENNTAETPTDQTVPTGNIITIHTTLGDEDEDVHRCGRCQVEFTTLEAFIQHKLQNSCQRAQEVGHQQPPSDAHHDLTPEVVLIEGSSVTATEMDDCAVSSEESDKTKLTGRGPAAAVARRRRSSAARSSGLDQSVEAHEVTKILVKVNEEGRYVCHICEKTFKTVNILRTHLTTHSEKKNFHCKLCGNSFRTKGSLIRHNRRHTDERPYRCNLCGLSFRESGALTRHLKSITPCTEKIRFSQCKEILVSKDGVQKGFKQGSPSLASSEEEQLRVVSVMDNSEEVIQEVHVQMEVDSAEQTQQEEQHAESVEEGDSLLGQAIINSGIKLETDRSEQPGAKSPMQPLQSGDPEGRITEIQVTEECVELDSEDAGDPMEKQGESSSPKVHRCPHCSRSFKALNYLRVHVKGHLGFKPFKCMVCQKEFLTGYLLKKHMEAHLSERRFKCGECGKLYKTIGHVREHMRAHSDERPYHCNRCSKGYKTKNALQVHQRTHAQDRPYVCQYCSRGFREKGSLVRHIRHHTGEKPFKCFKCSRGFAEHGTLNRHLRAKGGCNGPLKESEQPVVLEEPHSPNSMAATIISEDPHAVLVEFSSVVADTQEYIIQAPSDVTEADGEVPLSRNEVGSHIMKVVQQIVSQSQSGHQIIVQNVSMDENAAISSDCGDTITIATPESLTEQVAMTLASAISDGAILTTDGTLETADGTVTMVESRDIEVMEQAEEFVITSPEEVEIQTVIVQD
ncbi:transcription factor E4F1 isoform X1 [Anguilla anguilla]|uniref:transcription factor E4F1 isoform X1 n=2 Tax=Anguilla anguilla TaxID=7936 RepID=UPI0015AC6259|nr:transcription factor E4F1 isoform X1 [Anguilla anguilla]